MVLLWGIAWCAARDGLRRFAAFLFCFGIWDIVYYMMLKASLGWPASWVDPDILFLIPVPWIGPVLAPVLVAAAMSAAGALVLAHPAGAGFRVSRRDWVIEIGAAAILLASFLWNAPLAARGLPPGPFPWAVFAVGLVLGAAWFGWIWRAGTKRPGSAAGNRAGPDRSAE